MLELFDQLLRRLDFISIFQTVLQNFVDTRLGEIVVFDVLSFFLELIYLVLFLDRLGDDEIADFEETVSDGKD